MPTAVRTESLSKDFPSGFWRPRPRRALAALSIDVPTGVVFGLLGPNGAGKTTTLKLLLNLIWPTAGRAEVLGAPVGHVATRARLGYLPEQPVFYDQLSAEELLGYFAGLFGYVGAERRRRASRALDLVRLEPGDRRRPLRQFSKGMVQRVGLAQALLNDPELVILDEPMAGLDPLGRREVRELILRLRDDGRTVLFSSHILADAELLCSRVAILSKGRLVASGLLSDLTSRAGPASGGWEVVAEVSAEVAARLAPRVRRLTRIAERRYSVELSAGTRPEPFVAELAAAGASLMSVTPLRASLEDVFMEHVGATGKPATAQAGAQP